MACCKQIKSYLDHVCPEHPDPHDCTDYVVARFGPHIGIPVRDGGSSFIVISFCPWCGASLTCRDEILSIGKCAEIVGIHPDSLRKWEEQGLIRVRKTLGGHRRYSRSEAEAIRDRCSYPEETSEETLVRLLNQVRMRIQELTTKKKPVK